MAIALYSQLTIHRPIINASAKQAATARLFCDLFQDSIAEELYDVERAGLQFSVKTTPIALTVKVMGYNDTLQILTARMLELMRHFEPTAERLASVKDQVSTGGPWRMALTISLARS